MTPVKARTRQADRTVRTSPPPPPGREAPGRRAQARFAGRVRRRVFSSISERLSWRTWFRSTELKRTQTVAPARATLLATTTGSVETSSGAFSASMTCISPGGVGLEGGRVGVTVATAATAGVADGAAWVGLDVAVADVEGEGEGDEDGEGEGPGVGATTLAPGAAEGWG